MQEGEEEEEGEGEGEGEGEEEGGIWPETEKTRGSRASSVRACRRIFFNPIKHNEARTTSDFTRSSVFAETSTRPDIFI